MHMPGRLLKSIFPRGLYGRAALILLVPVVTLLVLVSVLFVQRHYERVTQQMTSNFALVVGYLRDRTDAAPDAQTADEVLAETAAALDIEASLVAALRDVVFDPIAPFDLSSRLVLQELSQRLTGLLAQGFEEGRVVVWVEGAHGIYEMRFSANRVAARNPHQLLVIVLVAGAVMSVIAFLFLKNQMRPILRLARVAEAFGRGESLPYHPTGATEVRAAGQAFLEMRKRIEDHIEQRTLLLSGVSHDLRTPLTRMRLALSMMEDEAEAQALLDDVSEMEALIDRFLEFARGQLAEAPVPVRLRALVEARLAEARRAGQQIGLRPGADPEPIQIRPGLVARALDNLIGNATRYGTRAELEILQESGQVVVRIEDDGPGIAPEDRATALRPFVRLDPARGASAGAGVGLGLAIAADAVRQHGGRLELGQGDRPGLGGLAVRLVLPT
jgi:two-component system, OmpR family, osmolarity sensor histidine kinase EnvZ